MAPAPMKSSKHGRKLPSGHCSPAVPMRSFSQLSTRSRPLLLRFADNHKALLRYLLTMIESSHLERTKLFSLPFLRPATTLVKGNRKLNVVVYGLQESHFYFLQIQGSFVFPFVWNNGS